MRQNPILNEADESDNPLGMLTNLFDVAMVFAVALMVALVTHFNMSEIFSKEDYTIVKNPGAENMEIITKEEMKSKIHSFRFRFTYQRLKRPTCRDGLSTRKWRNNIYP